MDLDRLKRAEEEFFQNFPGGFDNPEMVKIGKKHKMDKMTQFAETVFAKKMFIDTNEIVNNMVRVVTRSSMVSLFEKPKFRDFVVGMNNKDKERLAQGLYEFIYGEQEKGFNIIVDILAQGKLAKWSLVTICPFYVKPKEEVFVKPTTAKGVIDVFGLENLTYNSKPTYEFYKSYREAINKMKKEVDSSLSPDNAHFSGFLMMSM